MFQLVFLYCQDLLALLNLILLQLASTIFLVASLWHNLKKYGYKSTKYSDQKQKEKRVKQISLAKEVDLTFRGPRFRKKGK